MITIDRFKIIQDFLQEAIREYSNHNKGQAPGFIVIYRDGVGGPTFAQKVLDKEIVEVQQAIQKTFPNYNPKLVYCLINKKVTTRLFEQQNGGHINPGPGTIVDQVIVERDSNKHFDFYMVANENPTSATALPVHYNVAYVQGIEIAEGDVSFKRDFENLTHQLCYAYYGFGGPIKTPASVKYAEKLANYIHENKFCDGNKQSQTNSSLRLNLHYL